MRLVLSIIFILNVLPGRSQYEGPFQQELHDYRDCVLENVNSCDKKKSELRDKIIDQGEFLALATLEFYHGLGYAYNNQLPESILYFLKAEDIASQLPASEILSMTRTNLSSMYLATGDTSNAIKFLRLGKESALEMNSADNLSFASTQIANLLIAKGDMEGGRRNLNIASERYSQMKTFGAKPYFHLISSLYFVELGMADSALIEGSLALDMYAKDENKQGEALAHNYIGRAHHLNGEYKLAILHCSEGLHLVDSFKIDLYEEYNCECLFRAYEALNDYENAFKYGQRFSAARLRNIGEMKLKAIAQKEVSLLYEQQKMVDSLANEKKLALIKEKNRSQIKEHRKNNILLSIGFGGAGIIALMLFLGFRSKKKDNKLILKQKINLEEKNREITDSIEYAQRIQEAILPPESIVNTHLSDAFVLYKPKDIVAGDFYWLEKVGDIVLFAAADCTGHGVPGAMVSVVCHNALNRAVREFSLLEPGQILTKTRELVIETFQLSENEVKDGMDIALCSWNQKLRKLSYAGANNSLYHIHNSEVFEIKGDKEPIGRHLSTSPFTTHQININSGDRIYISTDGFPDQFGGEKGKKYKYKQFRNFLISLANENMEIQDRLLGEEFECWRGEFEQVDDVCVIGVNF